MNMNQVYISGKIADRPRLTRAENGSAHLMFALSVRHRTARGVVKQELYTVNAWNKAALWGAEQLAQGQLVALRGYLTQHTGEGGVLTVEVTAEEFLLSAHRTGRREREQTQAPAATRRVNRDRENPMMGIDSHTESQPEIPDRQDEQEAASAIEAAS